MTTTPTADLLADLVNDLDLDATVACELKWPSGTNDDCDEQAAWMMRVHAPGFRPISSLACEHHRVEIMTCGGVAGIDATGRAWVIHRRYITWVAL